MIRKIIEIKNLGIFDDFHWDANVPTFERFNLIYGWNGSGKTTLSQLFLALGNGGLKNYPNLMYKFETDEGNYEQASNYIKKIRVFNQDYISNNIDISSCKANPIFILGEENKKLAESIRNDEILLRGNPEIPNDLGKLKNLELKKKDRDQKNEKVGKCFSDVAKTIGTNIIGASAREYRKNNAEKDFEQLGTKKLLTEKEIADNSITLKQQELNSLAILSINNIEEDSKALLVEIQQLLELKVDVVTIDRLKENPDISRWVEEGLKLHQQKESKKCEFCDRDIPVERINELEGYFNEADKELKMRVDTLVGKLEKFRNTIQAISTLDKANLFTDYQEEYSLNIKHFETAKLIVLKEISQVIIETENKKLHTTDSLELIGGLNILPFITAIQEINLTIQKHNEKSRNFSNALIEARKKLKDHYLSEIYDEVNNLLLDIKKLNDEINILENGNPDDSEDIGINDIQARITANRNKISDSGFACDDINKNLETFLGRRELIFENSKEGYVIKRNGELAKNLSEGEKTAIAFVYFIIHIKDREFNVEDGIVIIDDPISSLDSNSLFQAFSFLKNSVQKCSQVFILTHNYDFLQLIINWLHNSQKEHKNFYMINNLIRDGKRTATLDTLDDLLINYHSEYQYLFSLLYNFVPDGTIESVYQMPNIARKVLDNFLEIMIPDNSSSYKKLERINFDENKKTAIYKFTNDQSHITGKGFDPSLLSETQNVRSYLLEMIKTVFPSHYDILEKAVKDLNKP